MVSEDSLAIVNTFFTLLETGAPVEDIAAMFSDNVDWDVPGAGDLVPWVGKRHSPAAVADFYRTLGTHTQPVQFDVHAILPSGDTVVVLGYFESRVIRTQKTICSEYAMTFGIRDGKISHYRFFENSFAVAKAMA